jgi:hypothetical protein
MSGWASSGAMTPPIVRLSSRAGMIAETMVLIAFAAHHIVSGGATQAA